jgi:hypothetical protein
MGADYNVSQPPRSKRQEDAVALVAREAIQHGISHAAFVDSVTDVRDEVEVYQRALHTIEARKVVLQTLPGKTRSDSIQAIPDATNIDPWQTDVVALAQTSRVHCWCPTCLGSGAMRCKDCKGAGRTRCPRCDGRGTDASGSECIQCAGSKKILCARCHGDQVPCVDCESLGEVEAWLEVERTTRQDVCVHPMGAAARSHPRVQEIANFDEDPARWPNPRIDDTRTSDMADISRELYPALKPNERSVMARVQRFQAIAHTVTYATALGSGLVLVTGTPLEVSQTSHWKPLELRRTVTWMVALVGFGCALAFALSYPRFHPWYARVGSVTALTILCVGVACAASVAIYGSLLAARARTPMRQWVPAAVVVLLMGAIAVLLSRAQPRISSARASLQRGDLLAGRIECEALRESNTDRAAAEQMLDAIHQQELTAAHDNLPRLVTIAQQRWYSTSAQTRARAWVTTTVDALAHRTISPSAREEIARIVRPVDAALSEKIQRDVYVSRALACAEAGDGVCAREQVNHALEHGANPSETESVLRVAQERLFARFRTVATRAMLNEPSTLHDVEEAIVLSSQCTLYTNEATSPSIEVLRTQLARIVAHTDSDAGVAVRRSRHRQAHGQ